VTSSVDGLVSGLSTSSLISQLMTVEAAPQTRLKTKVTTAQTAAASYQSVNSKVASLKSAGDSISQLSTWRSIKATSSSSSVSATASTNLNSTSGSLTFDVTSLAGKQSTTMPVATYADSDNDGTVDTTPLAITSNDSLTYTPGTYDSDGNFTASGAAKSIDISADKSAAGIAKAINAAGVGATAYVMKTSATDGVLQVTGTKTGAANGFQISGLEGSGTGGASLSSTYAKSATLSITGGGGNTYSVNSDTNTFTGLMAGVTVTVSKVESGVTIDAANDISAISDKFQALVDAANATLSEIGSQTAYDASTKKGSPLTGDFSVRDMSSKILSSISQGLSYADPASTTANPLPDIKFGSLKGLGIQLDSTGKLTFDSSAFEAAYNANPSAVQQAGIAFGDKTEAMTTQMTTNLTSVITGRNSEIDSLNTQIDNWDVRLAVKREALQKQYSDLEVSLGKLKDQGNWLSGQLAGLS
jgi:flagellar hook-associated protein 2